jgi:hypothetical protein
MRHSSPFDTDGKDRDESRQEHHDAHGERTQRAMNVDNERLAIAG